MSHEKIYFHISFRNSLSQLFKYRPEKFAFLNIWRTYMQNHFETCAYTLLPGRFECVIGVSKSLAADQNEVTSLIKKILSTKMEGAWDSGDISRFCESLRMKQLFTEKECIYRIFDLHTLPQKIGISTDYRTYPFSSYKALSSVQSTVLSKTTVWQWFGGRMRFAAFHQAYAGWTRPEVSLAG